MNNLSTNQKIAIGVGTAATLGAVLAAYFYSRSGKEEETDEDVAETPTAQQTKKESEPTNDRAAELRAEGNKAFTNKDFDEAIRLYTEALALSDINAHLLYSNRSAAFLFKGDTRNAVEDAEKCLKIKPDWSKGYFRMGKALMASGKYDEAFKQFYKGTLIDKSSEELRVLLEQCARTLSIGEKDSRAHTEKEMVKLHSKEQCEDLCNNVLGVSFAEVKGIVEKAVKEGKASGLVEDSEVLEKAVQEHPVEAYRVLAEVLLELERVDEAHVYSTKAHEARPTDPAVLLLLVTTMLRSGGIDQYVQAFEHMREALRLAPNNVQIIHTYASILLQQSAMGVKMPAPIKTLLDELKKGLDNPGANHLLIADSGMRLWFKLLEEHTNDLIAEEQQNMRNQTPPDQAYIYGLTQGAFSKVCLEPFFQQSLSQVVFSNPGLETVLTPFRSAFMTLKPDSVFDTLATFIFALSLQCYRNNYSWPLSPEDKERLETLISETEKAIESNAEGLIVDGVASAELLHHLTLISLFQPLHKLNGISSVVSRLDLKKHHEWFAAIIKKTVFDFEEEQKIKQTITPLTKISESDSLMEFYEGHVAVWDSAGLAAGRLTTVSVAQELSWLWKYYTPRGLKGPVKTLVAGCGSGVEVYQYATYYKDVEITAIDLSANNLAFAIRQHKDLGIENIKFHQADITELEPSTFPEQFDMVIANGVIHHLKDPIRGWQRLASLLRSGGIMRMSLYSGKFVELLQKTREFLNQSDKIQPPLFTKEKPLAQVRRTPEMDEVRTCRTEILACDEKDLEDLKELVTSPQFYALNEFYDLVFHPKVQGFSFEIIGECLKQVGLKLIGFEFPGLSQEHYLKYIVEFPDDPDMVNVKNLENFNKKFPDAFKNFTHTINFLAEKP